jgi:protein-tyrosine phosphatase
MTILDWPGCFNVRDVGGLHLADGGQVRDGVLIRSDAVKDLEPEGWEALAAADVSRIVDLRYLSLPSAEPPDGVGAEIVRVELYPDDPTYWEAARDQFDGGGTLEDYLGWQYVNAMATRGPQLAAAITAIGAAEEGAVVIHCQAGKDRTGLVVALVLRLAGVPAEEVAADFALTGSHGMAALDRWVEEATDPEENARRTRLSGAPSGAILRAMEELEQIYGGAEAYLLANGADPAALARLCDRLRG